MGAGSKIRGWGRSIWALLAHASTAITYLQIFGVWAWLGGLAVAAMTAAGGIIEGVSFTLLAVAVLVAFAAGFSLVLSIKLAKASYDDRSLAADEMWNHVDELMVFQAACLWAGREPKLPVPKGRAYAAFTLIKGALRAGTIQASDPTVQIDKFIRVNRAELRRLAESKGLRPDFLFQKS
jgi:hypothetical protein